MFDSPANVAVLHQHASWLAWATIHGRTYLPADVTARHKVRLSTVLRGEESAELRDAMHEVADEAVAHLLAARSHQPDVPAAARAVLLPATVADHLLARLQRNGYSTFAAGAQDPLGPSLQLSLLWRRLMGTF